MSRQRLFLSTHAVLNLHIKQKPAKCEASTRPLRPIIVGEHPSDPLSWLACLRDHTEWNTHCSADGDVAIMLDMLDMLEGTVPQHKTGRLLGIPLTQSAQ